MFTLIDEDAIVPFDDFVKTADDKAWLDGFYKAFMLNSQTGGKTWGIPFQRSTDRAVLEQGAVQGGRARSRTSRPATWAEMVEYAKKLTKTRRQRQRHAVGRADPVRGLPVLAVPGLTTPNDAILMNEAGTADLLRQARR